MTARIAAALSESVVFRSLDGPELDRLAATCRVRSYTAGEVVFLRGDRGSCMYVVAAGAVQLSLDATSGRDVLLAVLRPPDSFGELAVVDGGPRVATALAQPHAVLVVVPGVAVHELIARRPSSAVALLASMAALVRRLDEQACDAALLDLPERVAKLLLAGVRGPDLRKGPSEPDGAAPGGRRGVDAGVDAGVGAAGLGGTALDRFIAVDLPLTQGDLARRVGGSRQRVNGVLRELEAAGSIRVVGHRVVGVRPDRLRQRGE